jgi:hypothetical protein
VFAGSSENEPCQCATAEQYPRGNEKSFRFHIVVMVVVMEGKIIKLSAK